QYFLILRRPVPPLGGGTRRKLNDHQARMRPFAFKGREVSPTNDKLATKCRKGCGRLLAVGCEHRLILQCFGSNEICLHAKSLALTSPTRWPLRATVRPCPALDHHNTASPRSVATNFPFGS